MLVAAWVTAIATVGLLLGAMVTAIFAWNAYQAQAKQLADQVEANKKQAQLIDLQLRAQAQRVLVWQKKENLPERYAGTQNYYPPQSVTTVYIHNTSDTSVHDVTFFWYDDNDYTGITESKRALRPKEQIQATREHHPTETHKCKALVSFIDDHGVPWVAKSDPGKVEPVSLNRIPPPMWPGELSELLDPNPHLLAGMPALPLLHHVGHMGDLHAQDE